MHIKPLLIGGLIYVFSNIAIAQMDHTTHAMSAIPAKPIACNDSGLDCANAATPFITSNGKLLLAYTSGGKVSVVQSSDMGDTFSVPVIVGEHGKSLDVGSDARPQIVANSNGNVFLAYSFFKDSKWNAQINTARSTDGGATFTNSESLITNGSSERFPSVLIRPNGSLFAAWIDKRLVADARKSGLSKLGGSIAYSFSEDGGMSFARERIANSESCECCRIGASLDPKGNPVIVYRAIFPGGIRDHATQVITSTGAQQLQRIANDDWKTDACPHHGPSIAVSIAGTYHVAWFTQGKARSGVFYANSHNQGKTYSMPIRVGNENSNVSRPYLLAIDKSVWLVWKEFDGQTTSVLIKNSTDDGLTWSTPSILAHTTEYSDHPLLISYGKQVFLSWLTRADGYQLKKVGQAE